MEGQRRSGRLQWLVAEVVVDRDGGCGCGRQSSTVAGCNPKLRGHLMARLILNWSHAYFNFFLIKVIII